jgi:predicted RNase H-like nuclease (RuvC/YqgF family)
MSIFKDGYDILKDLAKMAKEAENQEMASKVVDIQEKFFDIREEMEEIKEENRNLKDTIARMHNDEKLEKDLELTTSGYYIRKTEKEQGKNIKYCAACWQNLHKLMPFTRNSSSAIQCSNCHHSFRDYTN